MTCEEFLALNSRAYRAMRAVARGVLDGGSVLELVRALEETLTLAERNAGRAHIAACPKCRAKINQDAVDADALARARGGVGVEEEIEKIKTLADRVGEIQVTADALRSRHDEEA